LHKLFYNTVFIGKKAFYLPTCHSTNELAAVMISNNKAVDGTVIYSDKQLHGKGQRGNSWESEQSKNLLFSIILKADFIDPSDNFFLTQISSLAIHDFLTEYVKTGLKIKWPNDIVYSNKKIAGILIENFIQKGKIEWTILGIGVNINQIRFAAPEAISLSEICGQQFNREELLTLLLQRLEKRYIDLKNGKIDEIRKNYLKNMFWKDEIHVFQSDEGYFNGKILGVSSGGKLHVEMETGLKYFNFKELKFIK